MPSCAVTCSNLQMSTADSCNIYFVEAGICTAGVLDYPMNYSKPFGSSATLVPVKTINTRTSGNLGLKVKPGDFAGQNSVSFITVSTFVLTQTLCSYIPI